MSSTFVYAVCRDPFEKDGLWYVLVLPLMYSDGQVCDPADFPDENGHVFWLIGSEKPQWVAAGALCTLRYEQSRRMHAANQCWYQTVRDSVTPVPMELVDLSFVFATEDDLLRVRKFATRRPLPRHVFAKIGEYVFGPFQIKAQGSVVNLDQPPANEMYFRYGWRDVYEHAVRPVYIGDEEERWIIPDEKAFATLSRTPRDGRSDEQLVTLYLRGLRDSGELPTEVEEVFTRKTIQHAASTYGLFAEEPDVIQHRLQRLLRMGDAFSRAVQKDPSVIEQAVGKELFQQMVERRKNAIVVKSKKEIAEAIKPIVKERNELRKEKEALEKRLAELQIQIAKEEAAFREKVEIQRQRLIEARQHLADERDRLVNEYWALTGLMAGHVEMPIFHEGNIQVATAADGSAAGTNDAIPVKSLTYLHEPHQLYEQMTTVFGEQSKETAGQLHRLINKHRIFCLRGVNSFDAVARYAAALGPATRLHQALVEPGWINLQPLLGKVNERTRRFEPAPGDTLEFWLEAMALARAEQGGIQIIALHDANRSPIEVWLNRLIVAANGVNDYAIPLFHPGQITGNDPLLHAASLQWPSNLRIICFLADDEFSYEPSAALRQKVPIQELPWRGNMPALEEQVTKSVLYGQLLSWDWSIMEGTM